MIKIFARKKSWNGKFLSRDIRGTGMPLPRASLAHLAKSTIAFFIPMAHYSRDTEVFCYGQVLLWSVLLCQYACTIVSRVTGIFFIVLKSRAEPGFCYRWRGSIS